MTELVNGRFLISPTTNSLQSSNLAQAGEAANLAAADYIFIDYRQRRAEKTIQTQTAALLLWVQFLDEVGAADGLVNEAQAWAASYFDNKTQADLREYAQSQQTSLPIIYIWGTFLPAHACCLARRYMGFGRRVCEVAAKSRVQCRQCQQPLVGGKSVCTIGGQSGHNPPH